MIRSEDSTTLRALSGARSFSLVLCTMLAFAGVCVCLPSPPVVFRLGADTFVSGAWHTLWTGHLLHYTAEHFVWDVVMFAVLSVALWRDEGMRLWLWLMGAAPMISVALFALHPEMNEYRGLSSLDSMLFARFAVGQFYGLRSAARWWIGGIPLAGFVLKVGYECLYGQAFFAGDLGPGVVPLPSAHLIGCIFGLVWGCVAWRRDHTGIKEIPA